VVPLLLLLHRNLPRPWPNRDQADL
jgi:hypothetical protein